MRISEHANLRICDWEPVGREEKRILLIAAGRRRAKRVDVLRDGSSRNSWNRALDPASAVDEGRANDDARSVAQGVSALSATSAEPFPKLEDLPPPKPAHFAFIPAFPL